MNEFYQYPSLHYLGTALLEYWKVTPSQSYPSPWLRCLAPWVVVRSWVAEVVGPPPLSPNCILKTNPIKVMGLANFWTGGGNFVHTCTVHVPRHPDFMPGTTCIDDPSFPK